MRNLQSLRLLLADKDKEIQQLKERLFLYESDNDTVIMTGEKWEQIKEENKRLKKELTEEKNAYIKMYNMYVEKDNIINGMEKFFQYAYDNEVRPLNDRKVSVWTICLDKLQELKGEDKE